MKPKRMTIEPREGGSKTVDKASTDKQPPATGKAQAGQKEGVKNVD